MLCPVQQGKTHSLRSPLCQCLPQRLRCNSGLVVVAVFKRTLPAAVTAAAAAAVVVFTVNCCRGVHLGSFAPRCKGCKCTVCGDAYVGTPSRRCNCGCRVRTGNVCSPSLENCLYGLALCDSRIRSECWKFLVHPRLL